MYSEDIEKICYVCVHSSQVKGIATHTRCDVINGYTPLTHTCNNFKYDIRKKIVKRKKDIKQHKYTNEDFSL